MLWSTRRRLGVEPLERRRVIRARRSPLNLIHGLDTRNPGAGGRGSRAGRSVPVLLVVAAVLMAACQAPSPWPIPQIWLEVKGLGHVISAAPPGARSRWLLGGGVIGPDGVNQVAIWSAADPSGPWRRDAMAPVPGATAPMRPSRGSPSRRARACWRRWDRDPAPPGLPEAVHLDGHRRSRVAGVAGGAGRPRAFGGPNVVAIGGAGAGPHGYFIAGTWIGPDNHVVAAVWRSGAGLRWGRDDTEPAFDAGPAAQSYALAVADGQSGVLLGGTTAQPEPGDPTREIPTLWHSPDGTGWARLPDPSIRRPRCDPGGAGVRPGLGGRGPGRVATRGVDAHVRPPPLQPGPCPGRRQPPSTTWP